jgi:hypothetical protein
MLTPLGLFSQERAAFGPGIGRFCPVSGVVSRSEAPFRQQFRWNGVRFSDGPAANIAAKPVPAAVGQTVAAGQSS